MSQADAHTIWNFVRQHEESRKVIVVHCEQGMNRSPAVAAALAVKLELEDPHFWLEYLPNHHVYERSMGRVKTPIRGMRR